MSVSLFLVFGLLVLFQIKHFVADYPLQNLYMLDKFREVGWVKPLLAHSSVHGGLTFLIVFLFTYNPFIAFGLALLDIVAHFTMDRIKASPYMLGKYDIKDKRFWWSLGLDQMVHHLTHYIIIAILLAVMW